MKKIYEKCLKSHKIEKFEEARQLVDKEFKIAQNDLSDAMDSFFQDKYKWATIQAYYSMFHVGRSLIYSKGYREKGHLCLISAIAVVFEKEVPKRIVEDFLTAKDLREMADYVGDFSKHSASDLLESAKEFIEIANKIISA